MNIYKVRVPLPDEMISMLSTVRAYSAAAFPDWRSLHVDVEADNEWELTWLVQNLESDLGLRQRTIPRPELVGTGGEQ